MTSKLEARDIKAIRIPPCTLHGPLLSNTKFEAQSFPNKFVTMLFKTLIATCLIPLAIAQRPPPRGPPPPSPAIGAYCRDLDIDSERLPG
jgi:hypothetical protein